MEEILFKWIPTVGFPIVVACFVLLRIEPKLTKVIEAVNANTTDIKESLADFRVEVAKINGKK